MLHSLALLGPRIVETVGLVHAENFNLIAFESGVLEQRNFNKYNYVLKVDRELGEKRMFNDLFCSIGECLYR